MIDRYPQAKPYRKHLVTVVTISSHRIEFDGSNFNTVVYVFLPFQHCQVDGFITRDIFESVRGDIIKHKGKWTVRILLYIFFHEMLILILLILLGFLSLFEC